MANARGIPITLAQSPDFLVDNQGTIILLHPQTEDAEQWVTDHLPSDAQWFCGSVCGRGTRDTYSATDLQRQS
jgi:hypothetical protein